MAWQYLWLLPEIPEPVPTPEATPTPKSTLTPQPPVTAGNYTLTQAGWERYIKENKDALDVHFGLTEEYHRYRCIYANLPTEKCIDYSAFPLDPYLGNE